MGLIDGIPDPLGDWIPDVWLSRLGQPPSRKTLKYLVFVALAFGCSVIFIWFVLPYARIVETLGTRIGGDPRSVVRSSGWPAKSDYDLVIARYDEPVESVKSLIATVKKSVPGGSTVRVVIYYKGADNGDTARLTGLLDETGADEVVPLRNVGREGEAYLQHITRYYNSAVTNLASHTFFMQGHLSWDYVALPRLKTLKKDTGFMSLGPYHQAFCGEDKEQQMTFSEMRDIYCAFRGEVCPPTGQLITWAGQFVVSRERILQNPLSTYQKLLDLFDAPPDHWMWQEGQGWWNNEPSNPTLGHALERSWPVVFNCVDPSIAVSCGDGSGSTCQCTD